jgi:SNF2 family DNA or RNA helicase
MAVPSPAARKSLVKIKDETEYYQHQADGIRLMARMQNFLLADEMGLGKSLQALTVAAVDFELGLARRVLIVAPASLKANWADEIETFTKFDYILLGGQRNRQGEWEEINTPDFRSTQLRLFKQLGVDVLIVNYEQVVKHIYELNAMNFDIVIYDEAHAIKNYGTDKKPVRRTRACLGLKGKRHILITGSPLLNQVNELWTLLHRINPTKFPDYWRFVNRYCVKGGYMNKQIVGVKHRHELQAELEQVMIRRLKKDVLDLPDKRWIPVPVEFHPKQKIMYDEARNELQISRWEDDPDPLAIDNALTKALRLKQICGTTLTFSEEDNSYKLDQATEMCKAFVTPTDELGQRTKGEPIVVFSQFIDVQNALCERLEKEGVPYLLMNGQTHPNPLTRVDYVKWWGNLDTPHVLICGLQIAGVGLNMTAAKRCIFLDKLWVPKLNEQAEDRLHRIGADKTQPIQIFHIFVRNSIEGRIEAILKKKRKLFDSLVEESDWKKALYQALVEDEMEAMAA